MRSRWRLKGVLDLVGEILVLPKLTPMDFVRASVRACISEGPGIPPGSKSL